MTTGSVWSGCFVFILGLHLLNSSGGYLQPKQIIIQGKSMLNAERGKEHDESFF
jgi:hypothetical protein